MRIFRRLLALLLVFAILIPLFSETIFSQENKATFQNTKKVEYEKVNPDSGYRYILKRFQEKLKLAFLFSASDKERFYEELVARRLAELKYIVEKNDRFRHEIASKRYFTTAGQLTEYILKNKNLESKKQDVENLLSSHLPVIDDLEKRFNDTTAEWRFIKHDADYLRIYIGKLQDK